LLDSCGVKTQPPSRRRLGKSDDVVVSSVSLVVLATKQIGLYVELKVLIECNSQKFAV
jgi:hypothetical protein